MSTFMEMNQSTSNQSDQPEEQSRATQTKVSSAAIWIIIVTLIILVALIAGIVFLAQTDSNTTGHIRDIFIIVLGLESLVIGVALVILVIQLAVLLNLLQNEIKPILKTTRDTVTTLKGTTAFLSEHAIKPIINISSMTAGVRKLIELIGFIRK